MEQHSVDAIVGALNMANVRYLVAGGLAVVAHGYVTREKGGAASAQSGSRGGGHDTQQLERPSKVPCPKSYVAEEAHHLVLHLSGAAPAPAPRAPDDRRVTRHR